MPRAGRGAAVIRSVLVANRGEIARRVFRTARAMGLRCVAVYAQADADAPFVAEADEAVRLPAGYLDGPSIIAAATATGAEAIHPGYGFLAENAAFAAAVDATGLTWVGPPAEVIAAMGDKLAAKRAAIAAGVPTLGSSDDPADDRGVGYPLLVKGAAGGGGKGMRIVEESPSPVVDPGLRAAMGDAALRLARALGYRSAGTVEFLVDDATREFFFLEVNTRLQVEHPVTEEVTGLDLVREQLRVAAGEPLGYEQDAVAFAGHAIEARLYAEDPTAGFLPATGTLAAFAPAPEPSVRWESGVEAGSVVGVDFDPMLAKVVAHAPTRSEAAGRLALALERLHLGGVATNRDLLAGILRHPAYLAGDTTTDFLERTEPPATLALADDDLARAAALAALWLQGENRSRATVLASVPGGWRNGRLPDQRISLAHGDRTIDVCYRSRRDGSFALGIGGGSDGADSDGADSDDRAR